MESVERVSVSNTSTDHLSPISEVVQPLVEFVAQNFANSSISALKPIRVLPTAAPFEYQSGGENRAIPICITQDYSPLSASLHSTSWNPALLRFLSYFHRQVSPLLIGLAHHETLLIRILDVLGLNISIRTLFFELQKVSFTSMLSLYTRSK